MNLLFDGQPLYIYTIKISGVFIKIILIALLEYLIYFHDSFIFLLIMHIFDEVTLMKYLQIAGNSILIYLFIIIAIRIFGKKELSQLSVIDLVFILLISNSVQNAMVGSDSTVQGGIAAALGLFIANYIFKLLLRSFPQFSKFAQGDKIMLIHEGHLMEDNLRRSMLTFDELEQVIREHGVKSIADVDLAVLEVDGNISVLSKDYSHKTIQRKRKPQTAHNP